MTYAAGRQMFMFTFSDIRRWTSNVRGYIQGHTPLDVRCSWLHSGTYAAGRQMFVVTFSNIRH